MVSGGDFAPGACEGMAAIHPPTRPSTQSIVLATPTRPSTQSIVLLSTHQCAHPRGSIQFAPIIPSRPGAYTHAQRAGLASIVERPPVFTHEIACIIAPPQSHSPTHSRAIPPHHLAEHPPLALEAGRDINCLSGSGKTALMIASSVGNKQMVKALVAGIHTFEMWVDEGAHGHWYPVGR